MARLKSLAAAAGLLLLLAVLTRMYVARGLMTVYFVGGSAQMPIVLAKHAVRQSGAGGRLQSGAWETRVYTSADPQAVADFKTGPNPIAYGSHGSNVWLNLAAEPILVDATTGVIERTAADFGQAHPALAGGFKAASPEHSGFSGSVHNATGALAIKANNSLQYVISLNGSLATWEDFSAKYPAEVTTSCRGGRRRLCGSDVCVGLSPDPAGGQVVDVGQDHTDPMHAPQFVSAEGCVRRLGPTGPFVVAHQSRPGRDAPKDLLTAIDLEGAQVWSARMSELLGEGRIYNHRFGIVDDVLVGAAGVRHWWHGYTTVVGTVSASGVVTPPSG